MDNLERQLSNLPKNKLRLGTDLKIRLTLYKMIIQKNIVHFFDASSFKGFIFQKAWLIGLLVISMISSVSFYAYGSEQVTAGNALYPIKQTIETTKNILTASTVNKAKNYNELSTRRLEEALSLSNKESNSSPEKHEGSNHNEHIMETIDKAIKNFDQSVISVEKIENEDEKKNIVNNLRTKNDDNIKVLEEIEKNVNIKEHEDIVEKISEAKEKIKKYNHYSEDEDEDDNKEDREDKKNEDNKQDNKDKQEDKQKRN
jgi:hypothetical protein